jgi:hypothetical protein
MNQLYCHCCGTPIPEPRAREIEKAVRDEFSSWPIDEYAPGGGPQVSQSSKLYGRLVEAGITTIGQLAAAGDSLLDIKGIGPSTLRQFEDGYERVMDQILWEHGVTTVPPDETSS